MTRLRSALGLLVLAWLLGQASTLTMASALFWSAAPDSGLIECNCSHASHTMCPMHRKPTPGSKECSMRNAVDAGVAALSWLLSGMGIVPPMPRTVAPDFPRAYLFFDPAHAPFRHPAPDPPPPRA